MHRGFSAEPLVSLGVPENVAENVATLISEKIGRALDATVQSMQSQLDYRLRRVEERTADINEKLVELRADIENNNGFIERVDQRTNDEFSNIIPVLNNIANDVAHLRIQLDEPSSAFNIRCGVYDRVTEMRIREAEARTAGRIDRVHEWLNTSLDNLHARMDRSFGRVQPQPQGANYGVNPYGNVPGLVTDPNQVVWRGYNATVTPDEVRSFGEEIRRRNAQADRTGASSMAPRQTYHGNEIVPVRASFEGCNAFDIPRHPYAQQQQMAQRSEESHLHAAERTSRPAPEGRQFDQGHDRSMGQQKGSAWNQAPNHQGSRASGTHPYFVENWRASAATQLQAPIQRPGPGQARQQPPIQRPGPGQVQQQPPM
ncbi:hypothetical protein M501DRAFT_996481 [Patellaria atrata CBS 101060]|uniref:Uncharacterized protein n=1 Tax=Patellaria atrata CBS 101060 TaxID=1346257 RepID=A0A9P4VPJ5_9PEZI|nr:hypothetical protein M501DRAFT_996481 [Patellaria atrata CBS 101060]